MKFVLTSLCLLILIGESFATSVTVSGNVSGVWTADTVRVESNLTVQAGELLTISQGTWIEFQSYYRIDVLGRILAQGTAGDSITFTIRDTSNFNAQQQGRGGWSGIRFRQVSANEDSSVFSFCRFEFSKATEDSSNSFGGAILADNFDKLRFSNCLFFHNYSYYSGGAVYLKEADNRIENCTFRDNYSGNGGTVYGYGGGLCSMNSSPVVIKNEFYGNSSTGVGGAVSFDKSNPVFENNSMKYNFSGLGGALGVLRSSPTRTLANNLITGNSALFFGGGICCIRSFPVFSNLTISGNSAAYAGGFYCNDSAAPSMYNSIIFGNTGLGVSVYIWDIFSAPNFYYCDIEGGTTGFEGSGAQQGYHGQYSNNLDSDPEFNMAGLSPFQLLPGSPCKDAGTPDAGFLLLPPVDLLGAPRIVNNRIDMGAYEYNETNGLQGLSSNCETVSIYPNPFKYSSTISLPYPASALTEIGIFDLKGRLIRQLYIPANSTSAVWDGKDHNGKATSEGLYIVHANSASGIYTAKLIIL